MNLAAYLMTPVTPLYEVKPDRMEADQEWITDSILKREEKLIEKYRINLAGRGELSTAQIGTLMGLSKPLTSLRKLEGMGYVELVRKTSESRGRKVCIWRWK